MESVIAMIEAEVDHWKREMETLKEETERRLGIISHSVRDTVDNWAVVAAAEDLHDVNTAKTPSGETS